MPRARWNFHRGDCAGIQVALVNAESERERGGGGGEIEKREKGRERAREILRAEGNCIGSYTKSIRRDLYNSHPPRQFVNYS